MDRWKEVCWKEHIFPKKAWVDEKGTVEIGRTDLEYVDKRKTMENTNPS